MSLVQQLAGVVVPQRLGNVVDQVFWLIDGGDELSVHRHGVDVISDVFIDTGGDHILDIVRNDLVDRILFVRREAVEIEAFCRAKLD